MSPDLPSRIVCPRCSQDRLVEAEIRGIGVQVSICPECEACWPRSKPVIPQGFTQYSLLADFLGVPGLWDDLRMLGDADNAAPLAPVTSGAPAPDPVITRRFPTIDGLGCTLNQDWDMDYACAQDARPDILRDLLALPDAADELRDFLALPTPELLHYWRSVAGVCYWPSRDGHRAVDGDEGIRDYVRHMGTRLDTTTRWARRPGGTSGDAVHGELALPGGRIALLHLDGDGYPVRVLERGGSPWTALGWGRCVGAVGLVEVVGDNAPPLDPSVRQALRAISAEAFDVVWHEVVGPPAEDVAAVVAAYLADLDQGLALLRQQARGLFRDPGLYLMLETDSGRMTRSGRLRTYGDFQMHGNGCTFLLWNGAVVNWDVGPLHRVHFDAWRLGQYAGSIGSGLKPADFSDALPALAAARRVEAVDGTWFTVPWLTV